MTTTDPARGTDDAQSGAHPGAPLSARRQRVRQLTRHTPTDRRADTQRKLIEAGRRVIAQHGVEGTSVGSITAEAGFTRGAFYSNFSDLDHFVTLVAAHEWDTILATLSTELARALATALGDDEGGDGTESTAPTDDTAPSGGADIRHGGAPAQAPAGHVPGTTQAGGPEGPDSTASRIATSLTESTRPLLDSVSTRIDGLTGEERLALLARALLATVPRDCDSHLLWAALANFSVRAPDASPALRDSFRQFRAGMASYLVEVLRALEMVPLLDPLDAVDVAIAIGTRSMRVRLLDPDHHGDEMIDRVFPHLLPVLARPLP